MDFFFFPTVPTTSGFSQAMTTTRFKFASHFPAQLLPVLKFERASDAPAI
jgi:hypothetical protein